MKRTFFLVVFLGVCCVASAGRRECFNGGWLLHVGDLPGEDAVAAVCEESGWERVTLPRAWNEDEAFARPCATLSDTVVWYRKHFRVDDLSGVRYVEFEGVRQGCDVYLNGHLLGGSENGVMAFGFNLTPYVQVGDNVLAVRVDNDWDYEDRTPGLPGTEAAEVRAANAPLQGAGTGGTRFQWNNRNFNANYGGIVKNVWLHTCPSLHQTLPLLSNLGTTGTYIYGTDYDVPTGGVTVHAESQVVNAGAQERTFVFEVSVADADGREVACFRADAPCLLAAGDTVLVSASHRLQGVQLWSWGFGYLYTVRMRLLDAGAGSQLIDEVATVTGFRKTAFGEGKIWLNDRVMLVHGFAQRTSNEWPGVGMSVPPWLSDYTNRLMVEAGGNLVRWMHVTPWKQDVESCDRVGLPEAMPAGDAEKDAWGAQWEQRKLLMRDAIVYMRNNPSILFYECGNESISPEHMAEMLAIRNRYDPHGGRAMGSREMLDIDIAEYGGEMLYVNKSGKHPMWAMEYCRDEGLRLYWDQWSPPFHAEGNGPLYRNAGAEAYNHNQDQLALEHVVRWNEFWQERPGTGRRVSSGGVKIIFSDTNTHARGEVGYRTSGLTDAMRLPKDSYWVHQVMWDGWVEPERPRAHIIGHWNYPAGTLKPVYVISSAEAVELSLNGRSLGLGRRSEHFIFTFDSVSFEPGTLIAIAYDARGEVVAGDTLATVGEPAGLVLTALTSPLGFRADGADMALVQVEVVDAQGCRCPVDNRLVHFSLEGEGEWRGGIGVQLDTTGGAWAFQGGDNPFDNYVLSWDLPVECGVNRALLRSTTTAGDIVLKAEAEGLPAATLTLRTQQPEPSAAQQLPLYLGRGPTPLTPSYVDTKRTIAIASVEAGSNGTDAQCSFDDNELSEWRSDGLREHAWITYQLAETARVDEVCLKLTGWRNHCYPLALYAGDEKIWEGLTYASLGYVHIPIAAPVEAGSLTVRMLGPSVRSSQFGDTKELAGGQAAELDRFVSAEGKVELRIVEIDILQRL